MAKIPPQGLYAQGDSVFLALVSHIRELIWDCLIASEMVVQRIYDRPKIRSQVAVVR